MSTLFVGDITHIPFMNTSTTGMCVLQTTDEVDIGGHYNSTLEQRQCLKQLLNGCPNVGHSRAAIGQSEGQCPLTCTGHPPCRTPPMYSLMVSDAGTSFSQPGELIGGLTDQAASEFGLIPGTPVGASLIDAHAGGIGGSSPFSLKV